MVVIATWLLALSKIKIYSNIRGDPIKSPLYMLGGPIGSPINMPTIFGRTIKVLELDQ